MSEAYAPVKISRTKVAPVAAASARGDIGSKGTLMPKGTVIPSRRRPIT